MLTKAIRGMSKPVHDLSFTYICVGWDSVEWQSPPAVAITPQTMSSPEVHLLTLSPSRRMSTDLIEADKRGDIQLKLLPEDAAEPIVFRTCSRTLARVSPVFDRMLYGGFVEARSNKTKDSENWVVSLSEGSPSSMTVFLSIAHAHFHQIPKMLPIDELYELTALTHYYDATHILSPWVGTWMASLDDIVRDAKVLMPKMLWISWELGRRDIFATIASRLVMEFEGPISEEEAQFQDIQMPPYILGKLLFFIQDELK